MARTAIPSLVGVTGLSPLGDQVLRSMRDNITELGNLDGRGSAGSAITKAHVANVVAASSANLTNLTAVANGFRIDAATNVAAYDDFVKLIEDVQKLMADVHNLRTTVNNLIAALKA